MRLKTILPYVVGALAGAALSLVLAGATATPIAAEEAPSIFKNVKVLTGVQSKQEMRQIMKQQAASLGVKCSHCHVQGKFDSDEKEEKKTARHMLEMVNELNEKYFADVKPEEKPRITCWTCHAGKKEPGHAVPPEALAALEEQMAAGASDAPTPP